MFNVALVFDHLCGKCLFTWLSLEMSLAVSYYVPSVFPRDVFDEIWHGIESVSGNFLTYSFNFI